MKIRRQDSDDTATDPTTTDTTSTDSITAQKPDVM